MRRLVTPIVGAALVLHLIHASGCSSSSRLLDEGGCDAFCTRWTGAHCANGPTREKCLDECRDRQARCAPETEAYIRCATVEATIACEGGSGVPRAPGCIVREDALTRCLACDDFCASWDEGACPRHPSPQSCLIACTDPRCQVEYAEFVQCARSAERLSCSGEALVPPGLCILEWRHVVDCSSSYGEPVPFWPMPVLPDASSDGP